MYPCRFMFLVDHFFFNLWLFFGFLLVFTYINSLSFSLSYCLLFFSYFNCLFNAHFFASLQQSIVHYLGRNSFLLHAACCCCCCCLLSVINIKIQNLNLFEHFICTSKQRHIYFGDRLTFIYYWKCILLWLRSSCKWWTFTVNFIKNTHHVSCHRSSFMENKRVYLKQYGKSFLSSDLNL